MPEDRDRRRDRDPLHKPDSGKGRMEPARAVAGEIDSGDWRNEPTPVEGVRRRAGAAIADELPSFEWARRLEDRVEVAEGRADAAHALAQASEKRWKRITAAAVSALGLAGIALGFAVRQIRASGYDESTALHREQVRVEDRARLFSHDVAIHELERAVSKIDGLLAGSRPYRALPMQGPAPKDDEP